MHRISVASDAPALVLAIPGSGDDADAALADQIAEAAAESCPGVEIRIGYLSSATGSLRELLTLEPSGTQGASRANGANRAKAANGAMPASPQAVVVPLLAGSHPTFDSQVATIVGQTGGQVMVASHLGPHPLLAGALHDRLSEVGLARASRARGLNIAAGANGVLVVADRGQQAVADAGVTAVLLAARLAVPVLPASLGERSSIEAALGRLREAGATHLAIAPCLIGPETDPSELTSLSHALDAPCASPLGAHPAIAQLVAIRYGEALARISVAAGH
jgi:sirohydrochlorin ferrochelatase